MILERILQLLAMQMGHVASEKEIAELQKLLQEHPEHGFPLEILQSIQGEKIHVEPTLEADDLVQESWQMLKLEIDEIRITNERLGNDNEIPVKKKLVRMWVGRAAIWGGILFLASSSFFIFKQVEKKNVQPPLVAKINQTGLPYGAPLKKILPDGSEVWLNAGSYIRYSDNFIQKNRDVYLVGEAYFSVKHDADHPFIVHAGDITIRDLGTKFNVQAYPDESKIEATLISGKIMVKIDGKPDRIILTPNEKLTVTNEKFQLSDKNIESMKELGFEVNKVVRIPLIASIPEIAWVQDELAFENEPFEELAKRMERRYNIHIIFKDTTLSEERLSGVFENENIQKAMNLLQMTTPFHYQIRGDTVMYIRR
ncbi:MAG TPA: FecR domain-containing protein [Bacteroidia bacterium]|nr:FecR domain-containing protein [Bacteroidia bacterium]